MHNAHGKWRMANGSSWQSGNWSLRTVIACDDVKSSFRFREKPHHNHNMYIHPCAAVQSANGVDYFN